MEAVSPLNPIESSAYAATQARYATFWERLGAYLIDAIVISAVIFLIVAIFFGTAYIGSPSAGNVAFEGNPFAGVGIGGMLLFMVAAILYFVLLESSRWQATLGKRALGLIVTDEAGNRIGCGRAFGRYLSKILSGLILYIGYLMILWTPKKQGLHDQIAGTLVIKKVTE